MSLTAAAGNLKRRFQHFRRHEPIFQPLFFWSFAVNFCINAPEPHAVAFAPIRKRA